VNSGLELVELRFEAVPAFVRKSLGALSLGYDCCRRAFDETRVGELRAGLAISPSTREISFFSRAFAATSSSTFSFSFVSPTMAMGASVLLSSSSYCVTPEISQRLRYGTSDAYPSAGDYGWPLLARGIFIFAAQISQAFTIRFPNANLASRNFVDLLGWLSDTEPA